MSGPGVAREESSDKRHGEGRSAVGYWGSIPSLGGARKMRGIMAEGDVGHKGVLPQLRGQLF